MTQDQVHEALTTIFHTVFVRDDMVLSPAQSARDVGDLASLVLFRQGA